MKELPFIAASLSQCEGVYILGYNLVKELASSVIPSSTMNNSYNLVSTMWYTIMGFEEIETDPELNLKRVIDGEAQNMIFLCPQIG